MRKSILINLVILIIFSCTILSSCISLKYLPNAKEISQSHKRMAILPPIIEISALKGKKTDQLKRRFNMGTIDYQGEIYEQFKRKLERKNINIEPLLFYDYDSLLKKQVFAEGILDYKTFCEQYNVDGVIQSEFYINKQLSEGEVILANIVDLSLTEKEISLQFILYDSQEGQIYHYWNTHYQKSNEFYIPSKAINDLVRQAVRHLPYFRTPNWAKKIKKRS